MATQTGLKTPALIEDLLDEPKNFSYFQALRLLYQGNMENFRSLTDLIRRGLLVRASPQLGFPAADLMEVKCETQSKVSRQVLQGSYGLTFAERRRKERQNLRFVLTVTFMGLCGSASPLPPFYAQQILEDAQNDDDSCKVLFDLIALPSYRHHAEAFFHNQLPLRLMEKDDTYSRELLSSLMGRVKDQFVSDGYLIGSDLAYLSVLATNIRTAHGLISFLAGRLNLDSIEVEQCVLRWVDIPKIQRLSLGGSNLESRTLGAGALLGQRCRDMTGKFNLTISVNSADKLKDLMPGATLRQELEAAVDRYLTAPLVYDLKLTLAPGIARGVTLGETPGRGLGISAFLSPPADKTMTVFSPGGRSVNR